MFNLTEGQAIADPACRMVAQEITPETDGATDD
jgi:hypothetical protein